MKEMEEFAMQLSGEWTSGKREQTVQGPISGCACFTARRRKQGSQVRKVIGAIRGKAFTVRLMRNLWKISSRGMTDI